MKKRICSVALCVVLALLCLPVVFAAPSLQPTDSFYVNDSANVLSETTKNEILQQNAALEAACGAQIVVVTVNGTEGYSCEQYAYELANAWGIGSADKNNGVLLLLDISGQDYQCLQGRGLENTLPTTTLSRILNEKLEPDFAAGTYDAGVQKTFAALYAEVAAIYGVSENAGAQTVPQQTPQPVPGHPDGTQVVPQQGSFFGGLVGLLVFLAVVMIFISILSSVLRPRRYPTGSSGVLPFLLGLNCRPYRRSYFSDPRRYRSNRGQTPPPFNPNHFNGGFGGSGLFGGGFGGSSGGGSFGSHGSGRSSGGFGGGFGGHSGGGGGFRGGGAGRGH